MSSSVTLLLVEDDPIIRDILAIGLNDGGYEVIMAESGSTAFQQIESDASKFRAIITDIKLGVGPDGWDVARRARELAPLMTIIYMSGDSTHDWPSKGVRGSLILAKPFTISQLVTAVSTLVTDAALHAPASNIGGEYESF